MNTDKNKLYLQHNQPNRTQLHADTKHVEKDIKKSTLEYLYICFKDILKNEIHTSKNIITIELINGKNAIIKILD